MKKTNLAILLGLIIFLGLFLRLYHIDRQSYWMDEGYTINAVISVIHNGYSGGSSLLDSGAKYFCPLYCYPTQIISQAIGQNAFSYRLLAAIFGALFILLAFWLTKIIFKNDKAAFLSAFFVSLSYWQIAWSRQARWYTMLEVFFWLALLLFYLFLKAKTNKQKINYFVSTCLVTLLAIATHKLAYLLPLIMLIWYLYFVIASEAKQSRASRTIFLKILIPTIFAAAILAFAEYGLGLHFISHALKNVSFHYELPYYLNFYLRNYWLLILIAIYGYFSAEKEQKRKMVLLSLPFLIYLFFLSFFTQIVHYRYLFHTTLYIYMLAAVSIIDIMAKISHIMWSSLLSSLSFPRKRESRLDGDDVVFKSKQLSPKLVLLLVFIALFFISGEGVIVPKNFYTLEADDPSQFNRPYYAYTPQPDFNAAYAAIKKNLKPDEIVISSHPHFNKIFLNQPGYWIKYNYLGMEDTPNTITNNKEYYVGAEVIDSLDKLKQVLSARSERSRTEAEGGYIVFDYMSADGRIDPQIINYIQTNLNLFFYNKLNSYSQIWVYHF